MQKQNEVQIHIPDAGATHPYTYYTSTDVYIHVRSNLVVEVTKESRGHINEEKRFRIDLRNREEVRTLYAAANRKGMNHLNCLAGLAKLREAAGLTTCPACGVGWPCQDERCWYCNQ